MFLSDPSCRLLSGTLQIRYSLGGLKEPFTISLDQRNMANGQPHTVNIVRHERTIQLQVTSRLCQGYFKVISGFLTSSSLRSCFYSWITTPLSATSSPMLLIPNSTWSKPSSWAKYSVSTSVFITMVWRHAWKNTPVSFYSFRDRGPESHSVSRSFSYLFLVFLETGQVDPVLIAHYNTQGFVGCLSRVQFNRISPLKAALRPSVPSTASVQGVLVESNCGALPLLIPVMSATLDSAHSDSGETLVVMDTIYLCHVQLWKMYQYFKLSFLYILHFLDVCFTKMSSVGLFYCNYG